MRRTFRHAVLIILAFGFGRATAQPGPGPDFWQPENFPFPHPQGELDLSSMRWLPGSHYFWLSGQKGIFLYSADSLDQKKLVLDSARIRSAGMKTGIENLVWGVDRSRILIYTQSVRVWRAKTRGDYWYFDTKTGMGHQLGKGLPASSLMFAKFSDNGRQVAYVCKHNLYVEDLSTGRITQLTLDGTDHIINGTFDWVYEEELSCRDGFRWSPDSRRIAFWHVDARGTSNYLMLNTTDSLYPFTVPVEFPVAGEKPSNVKLGVIDLQTRKTVWMQIPGDPSNNYLPSLEWAGNSDEIMTDQLDRLQQNATIYICNASSGQARKIYADHDDAWIDVIKPFVYDAANWTWVDGGKSFLWSSEKDGWMHIYKVSRDGKQEQLLTPGKFDADLAAVDPSRGIVYFIASPYDATQRYLYRCSLDNLDTVRVTPELFDGTNTYRFSPDGRYAIHFNGSIHHSFNIRMLSLPGHQKVYPDQPDVFSPAKLGFSLEKFKIRTEDGVDMDGIMAKPMNFDSTKKYPLYFYVYGEPASATARDVPNFDPFISHLIPEGYIAVTLDNRGTPAPKGRAWRKSIYRKIGVINSRDQAMAARQILRWPFVDSSRISVHGWSGGGAMTLNLMFRYPEIFKTGIAIAAISDQRFYDNIYTERYMGLPQDNAEDYKQASPITFANNLRGNLLYIHGTGDDNVHYKNAEVLINALIRYNKLFSLMIYPNRTHGISEGQGTRQQLNSVFLQYLRDHCPPGAR